MTSVLVQRLVVEIDLRIARLLKTVRSVLKMAADGSASVSFV